MTDHAIETAARALLEASRTRHAIAPPSTTWPELTVDDAYAVQRQGIAARVARGAGVIGHKVGLTSKAMQEMLGIDQPDYGHLLSDMQVPDGGTVAVASFVAPRAEIEVAFVLRDRIQGPGVTADQVLGATKRVHAAIEIIDSRVADWRIGLVDTIADNASSGGFVLAVEGVDPAAFDLATERATLQHNGQVVAEGDGAAVLGHPAVAVAWLANTLGARGIALEAGHVVLSGACTRAVAVVAGDEVRGEFDRLGTVTVRFD